MFFHLNHYTSVSVGEEADDPKAKEFTFKVYVHEYPRYRFGYEVTPREGGPSVRCLRYQDIVYNCMVW